LEGLEFYEYQKLIKIVLRMWPVGGEGGRIQAEKSTHKKPVIEIEDTSSGDRAFSQTM
jgi:hypothetical protein